ncbi:hypothetical protein [Lunatimonas salinarum]|uniref:hypothetical protein n=1 Tax=Lunatimonas salinarum TaxID=1774590 RepID=UPI001AE07E70|nr:hypothetical protein [Lunatimonas salinarum]
MKKNLHYVFQGLLILLLGGVSLGVFVQCAPQELDLIPPFQQITEDFDEVNDLPGVDDPEPNIEDPDYEDVGPSDEVGNLLEEVILFSEEGRVISEPSRKALRELNDVLKQENTGSDLLVNLDLEFLIKLMNPENEIDSELEQFLNEFFAKANVDIPLPLIPEYGQVTSVEDIAARLQTEGSLLAGLRQNNGGQGNQGQGNRPSDLYSSCVVEANEAFQTRLADLTAQLIEQEDEINGNYLRRAYDAEERLIERNILVHELLMEQLVEHQTTITSIMQAATRAVNHGDHELKEDLLAFALVYAIYIRNQMGAWYLGSLAYNYVFYEAELDSIKKIRDNGIAAIKAHYEEAIAHAEAVLNNAIQVYCHNQGSGA